MSTTNAVLAADTSITLDWADVSGANLYHLQVSEFPDMSGTLLVDDSALATSTKSFTDGGPDDSKRYFRWRSSANAGTTWAEWSEVGSYWVNTGATEVALAAGKWALVDPSATTDKYILVDYPLWTVDDQALYRARERNRAGELLTEWLTGKSKIALEFGDDAFLTHEQMRAMRRFHLEVKTFFLCAYRWNGAENVPMIWRVIFDEDPSFSMLAPGREDLFTGSLTFEEV